MLATSEWIWIGKTVVSCTCQNIKLPKKNHVLICIHSQLNCGDGCSSLWIHSSHKFYALSWSFIMVHKLYLNKTASTYRLYMYEIVYILFTFLQTYVIMIIRKTLLKVKSQEDSIMDKCTHPIPKLTFWHINPSRKGEDFSGTVINLIYNIYYTHTPILKPYE